PVITSDSSSLPEILELPSSTFPAGDVDAMADRIARGMDDAAYRAELLDAGSRASARHTWTAVAARAAAAYAALDGAPQVRRAATRRPRARVAVVGPLPPVESGVALYNERVLAQLRTDELDLHLFVESPPGTRHAPPLDVPCYPIGALDGRLDIRD